MCCGCWEENGADTIVTDEIRALVALAERVNPFGCAHVVVEDDNIEDHNIDSCIQDCEADTTEPYWEEVNGVARQVTDREVALEFLRRLKALPYEERNSWVGLQNNCFP